MPARDQAPGPPGKVSGRLTGGRAAPRWQSWPFWTGWLDLAWALLWLLGLAGIVIIVPHEAIGFGLIWLGFALLYGLRATKARAGRAAQAEQARLGALSERQLATQTRFLQDVSHQLRTPITIALGHAELLARNLADGQEQRDIHVVVGELNRLKRLGERLLLIAASENPDFLRLEPVALDHLVSDALLRWRPTADRHWQAGQLDHAVVRADSERLNLALDSLLENAVQHTGTGAPIRLSVVCDADARSALVIVEDAGEGIARDQLARIFDRFARGPGAGHHGTGLGLALVAAVMRGHGGEVQVRSAPRAGSRFELLLPWPAGQGSRRPARLAGALTPGSPGEAGQPCETGRGR